MAIQYHEQIGAVKIVEMFESFGSNEGIFYFLGAILNTSTDPDVHFKYIQAASRVGNMQEAGPADFLVIVHVFNKYNKCNKIS